MRSNACLSSALALAIVWSASAWAAPPKKAGGPKKNAKELSSDDPALQKQMDWENKLMGPNTEKKIDLAKIQKLQAEEAARREKQEKLDKLDKDKKDREAAIAAQRKDVRAPSSREVPEIEEAPPPPPKPVEKHDDAFVDRLLKDKGGPKKKQPTVTNDEVDQLLAKAKTDKPVATPGKGKGKGADGVDQLLATADKQPTIKTTVRKNEATSEPVSAEAAAREAALKAIAAASAAKAEDERARNKRPVIPDAAVLRARAEQNARAQGSSSSSSKSAPAARPAAWTDPFATDTPTPSKKAKSRGDVTTSVVPPDSDSPPVSGRHAPSTRPAPRENEGWKDPFDSGSAPTRTRPAAPVKTAPAQKPANKRPANWKDPFA